MSISISLMLLCLSGCASTYDPLANVLGPEPNESYRKPNFATKLHVSGRLGYTGKGRSRICG